VASGCGDFEGAFGGLLAADIFEVDREVLQLAKESFGRNAKRFTLDDAEELAVE
jgi:hypothetical protein